MSLYEKRPDLGQGQSNVDDLYFPLWHYARVLEVDDFDEKSIVNGGKQKKGYSTGRVKVEIPGVDKDNITWGPDIAELESIDWCDPILPKYINVVPRVGEYVRVMTLDYRNKKKQRFYIGPVISEQRPPNFENPNSFEVEQIIAGASKNPDEKIVNTSSGLPVRKNIFNASWKSNSSSVNGDWKIYPDLDDIAIIGRTNTDFILRDKNKYNEVILRAGKIDYRSLNGQARATGDVQGGSFPLNTTNSAYITINFSLPEDSKKGVNTNAANSLNLNNTRSHINLVAENLNLISHKGSTRKGKISTKFLGGDKLKEIKDVEQKKLHPLIYGDVLWEFLNILKEYVDSHIHEGSRLKPDYDPSKQKILTWFEKNMGTSTEKDRLNNDFKDCTFLSRGVKTN